MIIYENRKPENLLRPYLGLQVIKYLENQACTCKPAFKVYAGTSYRSLPM